MSSSISRDNNWLLYRLNTIWDKYFQEVTQDNPMVIRFGRYSKYRLGSIKQNRQNKLSLITITAMFKDQNIPIEVVDHTIGHELVHYAHGFSSSKRRLHKYPHAGGVVTHEMASRGMKHLNDAYRKWIEIYKHSLR